MKKINYALIGIIIFGLALTGFWIYQKYFKGGDVNIVYETVQRGIIEEVVKVRGEVVAQKELNLEFPFSGFIDRIYVKEGDEVTKGTSLMKLETIDFEIEKRRLSAVLEQAKANLDKLIFGATAEDLQISETKVASAGITQSDAKLSLVNTIREAYTKSDDAVRNKADQLFNNPRSIDPKVSFVLADAQLKEVMEDRRKALEPMLISWSDAVDLLLPSSNLDAYSDTASKNLNLVRLFLDNCALAVNSLTANANLSQTKIDTWKLDISTARANVNLAIANLSAAKEKLSASTSALLLAENELVYKKAGARAEDIDVARAQIKETESLIAAINEKIRKSTLYAPLAVKIVKIWLEEREFANPGQIALSLSTSSHKLRADISELDIGKIRTGDQGNEVMIKLDAYPELSFSGLVVSVDPQEIDKEGDKYYRTNIYFNDSQSEFRSGMSADLIIKISRKENILKIPEISVYKVGDDKFVKVIDKNGKLNEARVVTGISDGEFIEIVSGLTEGQTVGVTVD